MNRLVFLCFLSSIAITTLAQKKDQHIVYDITYNEKNPSKVKVELTYTPTSNEIYMTYGAEQFTEGWSKFITEINVKTVKNKKIAITHGEGVSWELDLAKKQKIKVEYLLDITHEDHRWSSGIDGAAYVRENAVFTSGRSLFILPRKDVNDIEVNFHLPEGWSATTPWISTQPGSYQLNSFEELTQSGFMAGKHTEFSIKRSDFELVFALGGKNIVKDIEIYKELGSGVFDYYINLMGGTPNILNVSSKKCVIILAESDNTDGEVLGNTISILTNPEGDQMSTLISRFIFAHEFFHLWNGKSFQSDNNNMEWFREGVTNYYTIKSLRYVDVLDDQTYFGMLNDLFFQRYINDEGLGSVRLMDGEAKHSNWGIIYGGGLFAGMAQDIVIRSNTNNQNSLDDLMRGFFKDFGGKDEFISLSELKSRLSKISNEDQSEFFDKFILGTETLPIDHYLRMIGVNSSIENKQLLVSKKESPSELEKQIIAGVMGLIER